MIDELFNEYKEFGDGATLRRLFDNQRAPLMKLLNEFCGCTDGEPILLAFADLIAGDFEFFDQLRRRVVDYGDELMKRRRKVAKAQAYLLGLNHSAVSPFFGRPLALDAA